MPNGECELDCGLLGLDEDVDWELGTLLCTCPYGYRFEEYAEDELEDLEENMVNSYYAGCEAVNVDYDECIWYVDMMFYELGEGEDDEDMELSYCDEDCLFGVMEECTDFETWEVDEDCVFMALLALACDDECLAGVDEFCTDEDFNLDDDCVTAELEYMVWEGTMDDMEGDEDDFDYSFEDG